MPKRSSKDVVQNARRVFDQVIQSAETTETVTLEIVSNPSLLSQVMREIGRKGGKIGGKRRLETMTSEQRKAVARDAAQKRWAKAKAQAKPRKKTS